MTTALHDDAHDRNVLVDLAGATLGVAVILLLLAATLAGAVLLASRWVSAIGA